VSSRQSVGRPIVAPVDVVVTRVVVLVPRGLAVEPLLPQAASTSAATIPAITLRRIPTPSS
jgi:hypothetical protein